MPRLTRVEIGENAVSVTGMGNSPVEDPDNTDRNTSVDRLLDTA